jgi:hypothetical protein
MSRVRFFALTLVLFAQQAVAQSRQPETWTAMVVSALLEEYRDEVRINSDVPRQVVFSLNTRTAHLKVCIANAPNSCVTYRHGKETRRQLGTFSLISLPLSASPSYRSIVAAVGILDTTTGEVYGCYVTRFESVIERPLINACSPLN